MVGWLAKKVRVSLKSPHELGLRDTRIKFKLRSHMFDVKWNYKNNPKFSHDLWRCDSCQSNIETQNHILWWLAYSELRNGKDINQDQDLIEYMKQVLKIRDKLNITKWKINNNKFKIPIVFEVFCYVCTVHVYFYDCRPITNVLASVLE